MVLKIVKKKNNEVLNWEKKSETTPVRRLIGSVTTAILKHLLGLSASPTSMRPLFKQCQKSPSENPLRIPQL